jgi:type II secretory pathway pseudopilin PulG
MLSKLNNLQKKKFFTMIELLIIIVIIGILAVIAVPKFISMRIDAINAAGQANIAALRSAISSYYSNSATHNYLCTTANPYRTSNAAGWDNGTPCFPSSVNELEHLLNNPPTWPDNGNGQCYNAVSGSTGGC